MGRNVLLGKILNEGYCCIHGYIKLCQARNQTAQNMAEYLGSSPFAIWRQIRYVKACKQKCQKTSECMQPIIEEIEKEKSDAG